MKNNKNEVQLYGTLMDIQPDVFFKDDKKFKRIYIEVKRTSGAVDLLPVIVREGLSDAFPIRGYVYIEGRYISSNKHENGKSH